jgi:penicillin-insensitive murein endopeptidase
LAVAVLLVGCEGEPAPPEPAPPAEAPSAVEPSAVTPPEAEPEPEATPEPEVPGGGPDPATLDGSASASIGSPTEGSLRGGVPLPTEGPGYVFNPRKDPQRRHGTWELVRGLMDASAAVHAEHPGNTLVVGDLSMPSGGDIPGHASHRSGRDVDVMFYLQRPDGSAFDAKAIPIEPDGTGVDYQDLTTAEDDVAVKIDVPRTWAFVEALVGDERNHVARIFVVEHVREMLLAEGERAGAGKDVLERAGHLMCQPKFPHDDHMHIRLFCTPDDIEAGCLDTGPIYPWHKRYLKAEGTSAKLAGARTTPRPKLTSTKDAAKKKRDEVGAFDPAVDAFLERRKAWAKKPKTGRKYCR